eukprot:Tamp_16521.p1 GENE.Tamp_16521~~Tamp_16521.p1  ORF type:complete len:375 (-),score=94.20 Tamp_16521:331-1428(-)
MRCALARIAAVLALVNSSAGADRRLTAAAFSCSPLPSRLWTGCLSAVRRPAPALDLQMARGGGRKGAGRGGGRGGGAAQGVPADGGGAERGGKGSRQGKSKLNQLLTVKDSAKQTGGGAVSAKMQDFDPKNMERGTVRFLGSFDADPPKIGLPEVAFVGRSNVGKSSLLNALTSSKIAVTSKTPGRTQRVNIFAFREAKKAGRVVAMVDLPGFGFAQVSRGTKAKISDQLGKYIADREALKLVVVLIDLRVEPQKPDLEAMELLFSLDLPFLVVGTKADKLSNNELEVTIPKLEAAFGLEKGQLIASSSVSGEGKQFLWKQIMFGLFDDPLGDDEDLDVVDLRAADEDDHDDDDDDGGKVLASFM